MAAARRVPVVVILGATGTGKSKLSIELGRLFNGEIISADSMQMYRGLDVITNKVTAEEQAECPHHLLSMLSPLSRNNTVQEFRRLALPIMEKLLDENKIPVIVGGTNYYIESLLWDFLIDEQIIAETSIVAAKENDIKKQNVIASDILSPTKDKGAVLDEASLSESFDSSDSDVCEKDGVQLVEESKIEISCCGSGVGDSGDESRESKRGGNISTLPSDAKYEKEGNYAAMETSELHCLLQKVDQASALLLHPRNRRKIVRALQVYERQGVPLSQLHRQQHSIGSTPGLSGAMRYPNTCIFWLRSGKDVLDARLDGRVDDMLSRGLVAELHELHREYLDSLASNQGSPDYTLGIFQSIGFKEFHEYLILPEEEKNTAKGKVLFQQGVEGLKLATRQYARKQLRWIKNRFVKRPGCAPAVYALDSTDPSQWATDVLGPATQVLQAVIDGKEVPIAALVPDSLPTTVHVNNVCQVCNGRVFTTLDSWQAHLKSRRHKKALESKRRKERAEHHAKSPSFTDMGKSAMETET